MNNSKLNNDLQAGLEIVELEERLEMVQLSGIAARSLRCDSASEMAQVSDQVSAL